MQGHISIIEPSAWCDTAFSCAADIISVAKVASTANFLAAGNFFQPRGNHISAGGRRQKSSFIMRRATVELPRTRSQQNG